MNTEVNNRFKEAETELFRKYHEDKERIDKFLKNNSIEMDITLGKAFIRTEHGCWKLAPSLTNNNLYLMHRNNTYEKVSLETAMQGGYHKQYDFYSAKTIMSFLKYIKEHDEYKSSGVSNYQNMSRGSKKQRRRYESAKKKSRLNEINRVMDLFAALEMA